MSRIHSKHRERMRNRLRERGIENFSDHEVIELLLYFAIPRVNTNETAHRLMHRFGTLSGVFEAGFDNLKTVEGVGESAATLLSLISPITRRYLLDLEKDRRAYNSVDEVGRFLCGRYLGAVTERVDLLLFDAANRIINVVTVHEGSVTSCDVNPERIAELVFTNHAASFILAHNHPGGSVEPSIDDLNVTYLIYSAFRSFNVTMREHLIVSGGDYRGILGESIERFCPGE